MLIRTISSRFGTDRLGSGVFRDEQAAAAGRSVAVHVPRCFFFCCCCLCVFREEIQVNMLNAH